MRKKPSRNTVGRTCTTGRPEQFSACSESHCSLCCGLEVVSVMLKSGVHILRHTFCSHLAMRGAPVRAIQELAGHQDLGTTQRYMT